MNDYLLVRKEIAFKDIPQKPRGDYHSVPHYRCPSCLGGVKMYEDSIVYPYCHHCGQKLDWSEAKEKEMRKYQNAIDNFWLAWNCNAIQLDEIMVKDLKTLQELVNKCERLENALNKACEVLEEVYVPCCDSDVRRHNYNKDQWKEWCYRNE